MKVASNLVYATPQRGC